MMMKKMTVCTFALLFAAGTLLTGCKKKQPETPTDLATPTDMTTTVETTAESTAAATDETEIIEETNEKGERQTVIRTKGSGGGSGNSSSGNSGGNSGGNKGGGGNITTKAQTTAKPTVNVPAIVKDANANSNKSGFPSKQGRINQMAQQLANGSISASAVQNEIYGWGQMVENGILWEARSVIADAQPVVDGGEREIYQQCKNGFSTASYAVVAVANRGGKYYIGRIAIR